MTQLERSDRDALLAQLAQHPAWPIFKELMQAQTAFRSVDFADPAWKGKMLYRQAQQEFAIQLIRTVERAAEVAKPKTVSTT